MADRRAPLDPDVAALADEWTREGIPEWHELSLDRARTLEDELFTPEDPPPVATTRDLAFDGPAGSVAVRLYRDAEPPAPAVVWYHGGGWTLGTLDSTDDICRRIARRGDCAVLSVDYRLAPENPFPAALDDAVAALRWTADVAPRLGIDGDRLSVGGTSAGGNLAAATALRARDELDGDPALPDLDGQLLAYPVLDASMDTPSYREPPEVPFLTREAMSWFWDNYCPSPVQRANPYASPAAADLSGLSPATVVTAGHDPLRDEGIAYADRLAAAGVPVDTVHEPSLAHGFLSMVDEAPAGDDALTTLSGGVRDPPS